MAQKIPHHLMKNGRPACGCKGANLITATSASPIAILCGRCLIVEKARNPAATKSFLERLVTPASPPPEPTVDEKVAAIIREAAHEVIPALLSRGESAIGGILQAPIPQPVVTPTLEKMIQAEGMYANSMPTREEQAASAMREEKKLRAPRTVPETERNQRPATFLLDPVYTYKPNGRVDTITGTCPECRANKRTIHVADAFQVRRCGDCQKRAVAKRVSDHRKARRQVARKE